MDIYHQNNKILDSVIVIICLFNISIINTYLINKTKYLLNHSHIYVPINTK